MTIFPIGNDVYKGVQYQPRGGKLSCGQWFSSGMIQTWKLFLLFLGFDIFHSKVFVGSPPWSNLKDFLPSISLGR